MTAITQTSWAFSRPSTAHPALGTGTFRQSQAREAAPKVRTQRRVRNPCGEKAHRPQRAIKRVSPLSKHSAAQSRHHDSRVPNTHHRKLPTPQMHDDAVRWEGACKCCMTAPHGRVSLWKTPPATLVQRNISFRMAMTFECGLSCEKKLSPCPQDRRTAS